MVTGPPLLATQVGVVVAIVASVAVVRWLDRERDWGSRRRSRLLLGVPWGTLVGIVLVLSVYLFVQSGWQSFDRPVTVAFRSWSYLYPLGTVLSPFAHNGPNHLVGNLIGVAVLGTLAEYAWGHFPRRRGSTAFSSPATNPYVRAFLLFPAGILAVGLLTGVFSWGPVIGFSGVVFAFAGFAFVRYPLGTVIALAADDVVRVAIGALRQPVLFQQARPEFIIPWWAGIAIQGHLLGLFIGVTLGALLLYRREDGHPNPLRVWIGAVITATTFSLWALWWVRGGDEFVLFRGIGVVLVLGLALLVTVGLWAATDTRRLPHLNVPLRQVGLLALVFPALVVSGAAIPLNLTSVDDPGIPGGGPGLEVRDYTVAYAENVTDESTSFVNLSILGETTQIETSGVIVVSERRHVWLRAVSTGRLSFAGEGRVRLGGIGWAETVMASREGWTAPGEGTAYVVWLTGPDGERILAYRSNPVVADPILAGNHVVLVPTREGFALAVRRDNATVAMVPIPARNESVVAGELRLVREADDDIYAEIGDTRVRIAKRERYPGAEDRSQTTR